jgi:protein gp37
MNKTKIDWADSTWNPVTGCLNDCEYCYARQIAQRFMGEPLNEDGNSVIDELKRFDAFPLEKYEYEKPLYKRTKNGGIVKSAYPFGFAPTFHRPRLNEPALKKKPQNIFVGSMTDLFGRWVPDEWIKQVFEACAAAPQHRYLFLTKNPGRYVDLARSGLLPTGDNHWYGTTTTGAGSECLRYGGRRSFISIEPLLGEFKAVDMWKKIGWVIIGAETGNRKGKVKPERAWIENIAHACRKAGTPLFMKDSIRPHWGGDLVREFPWD